MLRWPLILAASAAALVSAHAPQPPLQWEPLHSGVSVRLRGVSAASPEVAWVSGARGTVLRTIDGGRSWQPRSIPDADGLDLRDIEARDARTAVAMSAGPGAASRIYRTVDGGVTWSLRYTAPEPGMFLDALVFSDDTHGIAFSDAVGTQLVVLTTADGGQTWVRVAADRLPPALPNEGAFAASGTNVAAQGSHVWIGTTASRVLHSADAGRTWTVTQTPVATGEATGIFSIAWRDSRHGVVVGGTYTKERDAVDNVATTADGGRTWQLVRERGVSGFRSVVTPVPALGSRAWLAVGPSGADWSSDDGRTWEPAGGDGYDAISLAGDGSVSFASGANGRIARVAVRR
jgi:photosystem II stability/assembly factor-like uncharacterized protein